jgi:hypothetical protein
MATLFLFRGETKLSRRFVSDLYVRTHAADHRDTYPRGGPETQDHKSAFVR